jgi:hypothetical protein
MPDKTEIEAAVKRLAEQITIAPAWQKEMIAYYERTGTFRPEDLRRILGDPTKAVGISSNTPLESFLSVPNS